MNHYLDTNVIVYAIENHPKYGKACADILFDIESKKLNATASMLVLVELVNVIKRINQTLKKEGKNPLDAAKNVDAVLSLPITWLDVDFLTIRKAAGYDFGLSGADCVHVATAEIHSIQHIISADQDFDKVKFLGRIDPVDYRGRN